MDAVDRELLHGMVNCFRACREDFEGTVRMVSRARGMTPEECRARLRRIREASGGTEEYRELRARLPEEFPL